MRGDETPRMVLVVKAGDREIRENFNPRQAVGPRGGITTEEEADAWGRATLRRFNDSCGPGEQQRAFVSCALEGGDR